MTQEQHQAQILCFPIKLYYREDLEDCYDPDVIELQLRLRATKSINDIIAGRIEPTPDIIENLLGKNYALRELGKPELSLDFLNLK